MDGGIGIIIVSTLGLFAITGAACMGCFCLCCAFPLYKLFTHVYNKVNGKSGGSSSKSAQRSEATRYQTVQTSDNLQYAEEGHDSSGGITMATATPTFMGSLNAPDEQMAHAYLVPPLVDVHTANSAIVLGESSVASRDAYGASSGSNYNINSSGGEASSDNKESSFGRFRDVWAAVLFLLNVGVVYYFGVQSLYVSGDFSSAVGDASSSSVSQFGAVLIFTVILTCFASVVGSLGMAYMVKHSETLIEFLMVANITMLTITAVVCILTFQVIGAVIFAVLACMNYWYLQSVKSRIPFASAVLTVASNVLRDNYTGLLCTAYSALALQVVWLLLWAAALKGIITLMNPSDGSDQHSEGNTYNDYDDKDAQQGATNGLVVFVALLSFYWGIQMIQSVVQTTVCGTMACWWFQPDREAPVRGSLFRAVTTSLGSICLGSLIVAFIQALREMLHMMKTQAQRSHGRHHGNRGVAVCIIGVTECLMGYVERAVRYFNKYAFCYVAAYGLGFVESGMQVTALFTRRGWTAIINDSLIGRTFLCGVAALAISTALAGAAVSLILDMFLAHSFRDAAALAGWGMLVGLLVGGIVGMVLTNILNSAVAMVFVCFAEDPFALQNNHGEHYVNLSAKWQDMHPHTLDWTHDTAACMGAATPAATVTTTTTGATPIAMAVPATATASAASYHSSNSSKSYRQNNEFMPPGGSYVPAAVASPSIAVASSHDYNYHPESQYNAKAPSAPPA